MNNAFNYDKEGKPIKKVRSARLLSNGKYLINGITIKSPEELTHDERELAKLFNSRHERLKKAPNSPLTEPLTLDDSLNKIKKAQRTQELMKNPKISEGMATFRKYRSEFLQKKHKK